jgi:NAD(P)-dependent dehydrogenase (short-subunit alcohol dehydrogenase family)
MEMTADESQSAANKVAVVTGGNRGLGLEACRQLARAGARVVLASRNPEKGETAAAVLRGEGLDITPHSLDVTDPTSIERLARFIEQQFGRLDILVNNAGVFEDSSGGGDGASALRSDPAIVRRTFETNTLGPLMVSQALIPLMHGGGRVVNVSSGMGQLAEMNGGSPGYRLSKAALNALTRILADELRDTGIKVNSVCPGWVKTDMGGPDAPRTPEQGVETIVWLATLPDDGPTGGFFRDKEPIPW